MIDLVTQAKEKVMKFIKYCSSIVLAILGLFITATSTQAASFSDQQVKGHPCLEKTSLPWRISPLKTADVPDAYKGWSGLWSGYWGATLCHTLVIKKITADGQVDLIYSTGQPYFSYGEFTGTITKNSDGRQQLDVVLGNGVPAKYTLTTATGDNPSYLLEGLYRTTSGLFTSVKTDE